MPICSKCKISKYETEFYKNIHNKSGLSGWCKSCDKEAANKHYNERTPEEIIRYKINKRKYFQKTKFSRRMKAYKSQFGLCEDDWLFMLNGQNHKCAICGNTFLKFPHLDHNHKTNKVRGLLCASCNILLGAANDNITILSNAINYLNEKNKV